MKPTIGMPQMGQDLFRKYMKGKYVRSIEAAGGQVRWIELDDPERAAAQLLECDGLLLPGGADVNPALYGQSPTDRCGKPNFLRDAAEMRMLEAFLPTEKPVLCFCRGVQLLNVYCGGTLHQDIKGTQKENHSHFLSKNKGIHTVTLTPGSLLAGIFREEALLVNSLHHQAADQIGAGLRISAVSGDGFVEALELAEHPFCIGVQWHPEHMSGRSEIQRRLFDAFIGACER